MALAGAQFKATLAGIDVLLRITARRHPAFAARLRERDLVAQIKLRDGSSGRHFTIRGGKVRSAAGIHPSPDVAMVFESAAVAARLMKPERDYLEFISALKSFQMSLEGSDELSVWFSETLQMMLTAGTRYGVDLGGGVTRYTNNTNGGPVFVDVKDGRILRITPIEFDDADARPWTIEARGRTFTPPRKTTMSSHSLAWKSLVYSPDRILYPLKRVDFDPARRAQSAEPWLVRLRTDQLGRGARHRGRRARARETRARARRHHERQRLASHVGHARLLAQRAHALLQPAGVDPHRAQPGQLGGLVLGRRRTIGGTAPATAVPRRTAPSRTA